MPHGCVTYGTYQSAKSRPVSGEANTNYVRKRGKVDFTLDSGDDSDEWGDGNGGEEDTESTSSEDSADEDWAAEVKPRRKRATKAEMTERRAKAEAEVAREKALRMRGGMQTGKRRGRKARPPPEEKVRIANTKAVAAPKKVRSSPYPLRIRPKRELH